MNNKVTACIIVKNDPHIEKCLQSIRPWANEIVVVDTGSSDNTPELAKKYADIFEVFTECNDPVTGMIEDFSLARQRSFDLATNNICFWQDSDDIAVGMENLHQIIDDYLMKYNDAPGAIIFPYEYAYDQNNKCILRHYRERLIFNKDKFHWNGGVHEVICPNTGVQSAMITREEVVFKHQRQFNPKPQESGRNLRILKKYHEKVGDSDVRQLYYLGLECCNAGEVGEAIRFLEKYVSLSGWDHEQVMACLKLVEIYQNLDQLELALKWAFKCVELREDWAEGYFAVGKMFYFKASKGGINEHDNWKKCIHFLKLGLTLPPTQTLLFINPMERDVQVYEFLNLAQNKLGQVEEALKSAETGLLKDPNNGALRNNTVLYQDFLARKTIVENLNVLQKNKSLDQAGVENVAALINNKPILNSNIVDWQIPESYDANSLPEQISDNKLKNLVLFLWKQYMLYDDAPAAINFLKESPPAVRGSSEILQALEATENFLNGTKIEDVVKAEGKLDIIFFAGNGVEIWTPETVAKTGIGGSELTLLELAKRLAKLGHKVRVYNSCGQFGEKIYDGVQYLQTEKFHDLECDVLIVSRRTDYLDEKYNNKSKLTLLWTHDLLPACWTSKNLLIADRILALSQFHKNFILQHITSIHPDQIIVTRNGVDTDLFNNLKKKNIKRNKYRIVNASSPDRSWPILLNAFPEIKKQVPEAELHLYYGFKNWIYAAQSDPLQMDLINRLKAQIKSMESLGVVYHDRVNQVQLAEEMLKSGVLAHCTWFQETYGISFANAQMAGLKIVSSALGALPEVVGDRGYLIKDKEWTSTEYKEEFTRAVVNALYNTSDSQRDELSKYAQENFGLDALAQDWEKMFFSLIEEFKINPIIPYKDLNGS